MIEKIIFDYLKTKTETPVLLELNGEYPKIEMPGNIRAFYLIEKTGSRESEHIVTSTLAIQSWAKSMYEAASANDELIKIMRRAITLDELTKIELNGDYNYTDTRTKLYRYQAVFDITHYEQ